MLFTGEPISAARAADIGLVNRVVPADQLTEATRALAELILSKSPTAIKVGKRLFYRQTAMGLDEAYELAAQTMVLNMLEDDAAEGISAFLAKRPPRWTGR